MTDKMTDAEVKKALEYCLQSGDFTKTQDEICSPCPYSNCGDCTGLLKANALDLINRQEGEKEKNENIIRIADKTIATLQAEKESLKAEVERLNTNISAMATTLSTSARATRHEAYKEFAERLKKIAIDVGSVTMEIEVDNLLNELVGD